jgi:monofunctional glycosyltransferase
MSKGSISSLLVFFFVLSILVPVFYLLVMPDVSSLKGINPRKTAFMEYREKEKKRKGQHYKIIQIWVHLSKISPYLIKAVIIAEDDKFWRHEGFDYESIQKAIEKDIQKRKFKFGGSTLSQQLARNLYLSPVKSLWRKTLEAILTWKIERTLSKRRILELYLNLAEWGKGIFGAEAASRHYFGKASSDLTPLEAARLAAVLPNPRKYDPTGTQSYVLNRARLIYEIMIKRGIVEPEFEQVDKASEENQPENGPKPAPFPPPSLGESNSAER